MIQANPVGIHVALVLGAGFHFHEDVWRARQPASQPAECDAVIKTVPLDELQATMSRLALPMWEEVTSQHCPHCGVLNVFPGFSTMRAYICKKCGEAVSIQGVVH